MSSKQRSSGYLRFISENPHLLAFGFFLTFASSLGQTFFIGAFGPSILKEFELSHTAWGGIYMAGTVMSALCLPLTGQLIDRFPLKPYTIIVVSGLCISGLFISGFYFIQIGLFIIIYIKNFCAIMNLIAFFNYCFVEIPYQFTRVKHTR